MNFTPSPSTSESLVYARPFSPYALAVAGFGFCDLIFVPLVAGIRGPPDGPQLMIVGVLGGILAAQFGVLPFWLVLVDTSYGKRLVIHWAVAMGLLCLFILGAFGSQSIPRGNSLEYEIVMPILCLPTISLGIEAPLWLVKLIFGWRLSHSAVPAKANRPLAIRDLMAATAVVAVALGLARLGASILPWQEHDASFWIGLSIWVGAVALTSALAILPLAWWTLRFENPAAAILAIVVYAACMFVVLIVAISLLAGPPPNTEPFILLFFANTGFAASLAGSFYLARAAGYRLQVGKAPNAA